MAAFYGCYGERRNEPGKAYYEAMDVMREDRDGRRRVAAKNLSLFGAPQVALMFMPSFGDDVRTASDIGTSFGYPDDGASGNRMRMGRVPVAERCIFTTDSHDKNIESSPAPPWNRNPS